MPSQRKATSITPVSLLKHQKWGNKVLKFLIFLYMHYGFRLWVEKNEKIKGSKGSMHSGEEAGGSCHQTFAQGRQCLQI